MVPIELLPPATPFTLQFTVTGPPPELVAVNACFPPRGTVAELGEVEMAGGGGGGGGVELPPPPPQPKIVRIKVKLRMIVHEMRMRNRVPPLLEPKHYLRVVADSWLEVV